MINKRRPISAIIIFIFVFLRQLFIDLFQQSQLLIVVVEVFALFECLFQISFIVSICAVLLNINEPVHVFILQRRVILLWLCRILPMIFGLLLYTFMIFPLWSFKLLQCLWFIVKG